MHCDRKDISKWKRTKKLKKISELADVKKKSEPLINPKPLDDSKKFIRVVKKDGTIKLVESK